ncbi:uncharacterized protein [Physcomitrium patens]|uniref:Uncharacterized protein n=1 Tax=Physcomitrium patens TaxID=3218 RepID=A0A7I4F6U3_PHYPA
MEDSSKTKLGRQELVSAKCKAQHADTIRRRTEHFAAVGRKHEFSIDSLDKEIIQTMSRGCKTFQGSFPNDSAGASLGRDIDNAQVKAVCSPKPPHPEPVRYGYASPEYKQHQYSEIYNGTHSNESTSNNSQKLSKQHHNGNGQSHVGPLSVWLEAGARSNGHKHQVSGQDVNRNNQHQGPGHCHHSEATSHRPGGNKEMHVTQLKDGPRRYVQFEDSKLDDALSSDSSEDVGEETRRKQASDGHQSSSTGGHYQQRPAMQSKVPKAPPSKWDDADKWIASPCHSEAAITHSARSNQGLGPGTLSQPGKRVTIASQGPGGRHGFGSPDLAPSSEASSTSVSQKTNEITGGVNVKDHIQQLESLIQNSLSSGSSFSDHAKRRDASHAVVKRTELESSPNFSVNSDEKLGDKPKTSSMHVQRALVSRLDGSSSPTKLAMKPQASQMPVSVNLPESQVPAETSTNAPIKDIFSNGAHSRSVSDSADAISMRESGTDAAQPSTVYRDTGTQMTPNPSVRLSRGAAPGIFISPSRHNTPDRWNCRTASVGASSTVDMLDLQSFHIEKLRDHTQGPQLHASLYRNLNWSTREEEDEDSATCLRPHDCVEGQASALVAWAAAWEEAERAKYTARRKLGFRPGRSSKKPRHKRK